MRYFANVLPRLETVLIDELIHKVNDASKITKQRGKVFYCSQQSQNELKRFAFNAVGVRAKIINKSIE